MFIAAAADAAGQANASRHPSGAGPVYLVIRSGDAGMSHSVNIAIETLINRLQPRSNLVVAHVGIDDAELAALLDMNTDGALPDMSRNGQGSSTRSRHSVSARPSRLGMYASSRTGG
ncbi:MAG: hypothetical protein ABI469_09990 [Gemmatimonadales bacterium]